MTTSPFFAAVLMLVTAQVVPAQAHAQDGVISAGGGFVASPDAPSAGGSGTIAPNGQGPAGAGSATVPSGNGPSAAGNAAVANAQGPTGTPGTNGTRTDEVVTNSDGTRTRTGTLSSHTQDSIAISTNAGTKMTMSVDDKTTITLDGKKVAIADLKAGMTVSVTTDGGDHAKSIAATK